MKREEEEAGEREREWEREWERGKRGGQGRERDRDMPVMQAEAHEQQQVLAPRRAVDIPYEADVVEQLV